MKKAVALLLLAAQAPAFYKAGPLGINADFIAGGSAQVNPPTEFMRPTFSISPPGWSLQKQPFYSTDNYPNDPPYLHAPAGMSAGAELRLIAAALWDHWEFRADYAWRMDYVDGSRPFGYFKGPASHRTWGPWPLNDEATSQISYGRNLEVSRRFEELSIKAGPWQGLGIKIGRQPIGLATNHYFSPNDLFQPFSPGDFLRLYRPGVDAARLSYDLGDLAQAEILALAGYSYDLIAAPSSFANERFAPEFDKRKAGLLGRLNADTGSLALGALFGWDASRNLIGLSLEQDLGGGWMLGVEGNASDWDDDPSRVWYDASFGLSTQFGPAWTARMEFASSPSFPVCPFCAKLEREQRSLHALGLNWDSQGLWKLGFVNLTDLDRKEGLLSLNVQYSLAGEADLVLGGQVPWRLPVERPFTATYFELAPLMASIQLRWFL